ncbi:MAG: hypothetical protein ACQKHC_00330 [Candidatus Phytoplasma pruni]
MSKKRLLFIVMFSLLGFLLLLIMVIVLSPKKTSVSPKPIPASTVEVKKEWFKTADIADRTEYIGSGKNLKIIDIKGQKGQSYPITKENQPYRNNQGKWMMPGVKEEGIPMIEAVYTFYGLEGLGHYQKQIALMNKKSQP